MACPNQGSAYLGVRRLLPSAMYNHVVRLRFASVYDQVLLHATPLGVRLRSTGPKRNHCADGICHIIPPRDQWRRLHPRQPVLLMEIGGGAIGNSTKIGNSQCTMARWLPCIDFRFAVLLRQILPPTAVRRRTTFIKVGHAEQQFLLPDRRQRSASKLMAQSSRGGLPATSWALRIGTGGSAHTCS